MGIGNWTTYLYNLWMKAVCTILGWCTAGAAAAGICDPEPPPTVDGAERCVLDSGLVGVGSELSGGETEPRVPEPEPLAATAEFPLEAPFASWSGVMPSERGGGGGGELFVGVVISIGSPGEGADVWMVGVMIGIVREAIGSSVLSIVR